MNHYLQKDKAALECSLYEKYHLLCLVMSQHSSLKKSSNVGTKRSVLKRFERVKLLQKRGQWKEGRSPIALPKTTPES